MMFIFFVLSLFFLRPVFVVVIITFFACAFDRLICPCLSLLSLMDHICPALPISLSPSLSLCSFLCLRLRPYLRRYHFFFALCLCLGMVCCLFFFALVGMVYCPFAISPSVRLCCFTIVCCRHSVSASHLVLSPPSFWSGLGLGFGLGLGLHGKPRGGA